MMATRVPTGKPRGRPKGLAKTGGRVAGKSLDRGARQLVSAELAGSIMETFEGLGGTAAMLEWATDNKTTFYTQILSRLFPAPQKDEPDIQVNSQVNVGAMSELEAARNVCFLLARATYDDPTVSTRDISAESVTLQPDAPPQNPFWRPPDDAPWVQEPTDMSSPYDADRARWFSQSPEERADAALVRETKECTLENYRGNTAEQGGTVQRSSSVERNPRAAQRDRMLAARRNKLL